MSVGTLTRRVDPVERLPEPGELPVSTQSYALALTVCEKLNMHPDWVGHRPSALAGTVLYVASIVSGESSEYVAQPRVADETGTSPMSIRANMPQIARFILDEVDLDSHPGVDREALRHLAVGGSATVFCE